jgi:hypothetical protein
MESATSTKTKTARRPVPAFRYTTSNAALAASIEAVMVLRRQFRTAWAICAKAENVEQALLAQLGTPRGDYNGAPVAAAPPDPAPPEFTAAQQAAERADEAQAKAMDRLGEGAAAMLRVDVDNVADTLLKLRCYAWAYECTTCSKLSFGEDMAVVLRAVERDLKRLSSAPPPPPPVIEWEAALAAYDAAEAACQAQSARYDAAAATVVDGAPDDLIWENRFGRHIRWRKLEGVDLDPEVPPARRAEIRTVLAQWLPVFAAREESVGLDKMGDEGDRLYDMRSEALDALMRTPPADVAGLARKLLIASVENDDDKVGFNDPAYVAQQLHGYMPERMAVLAYMDARRLAGETEPLAGIDFNPREWIKVYEAVGGGVQMDVARCTLMLGRAWEGCDAQSCRRIEDWLYATPWKARAVLIEVKSDNYRTQGGGGNRGPFSWLTFTDDDGAPLKRRIHFNGEADDRGAVYEATAPDEDTLAAAPDYAFGDSEALRMARAL